MEKIVRIQPYAYRKDKEYLPQLDFLKEVIDIIDSNFKFSETLIDEFKDDKPYAYSTLIRKFGSDEKGFEVIQEEVYEQVDNSISIDRVVVRAYGLEFGLGLEIESIRNQEELLFIELRVSGLDDVVANVESEFYKHFEGTPISQERLRRELLILNTSLKRHAWYAVEMRAKEILKSFPGQPQAQFAYSIARAAQGDFEVGQELVKQVSQLKPRSEGTKSDLQEIQKKKEEYELALIELQQIVPPEATNHPAHWMIDQAQKVLSEVTEALLTIEKNGLEE